MIEQQLIQLLQEQEIDEIIDCEIEELKFEKERNIKHLHKPIKMEKPENA